MPLNQAIRGVMPIIMSVTLSTPAIAAEETQPVITEAAASHTAAAAIADVRSTIREHYVLRDKLPAIEAALDAGLASGRYEDVPPGVLAERLSEDLFRATADKHLSIQYDPTRAATMDGPMGDEITEGPQWERLARTLNHGFVELRVLDGNVRYANLQGFVWTGSQTAAAFDTTMRFLAEGDAVVIDLRHNGGGSPVAIQYLVSHFVQPGSPLMSFFMGGRPEVEQYDALADLPAGSLAGKPLYVLISNRSISAAEAFAALTRDYGIGEVVGETTAGAAYRNSFFPVARRYMLSVSVGRGELGPSKLDWEGTGIAPTIASEAGAALDTAHLHALRRLADGAPPHEGRMMAAKATLIEARLNPQTPSLPLAAYAGAFADRIISVEGEALFSQRGGGPRTRLLAVTPSRFILEGDPLTQLEFSGAGGVVDSVAVIRADGTRQQQARTS